MGSVNRLIAPTLACGIATFEENDNSISSGLNPVLHFDQFCLNFTELFFVEFFL